MAQPSARVLSQMTSLVSNFQSADREAVSEAGLLAKRIHLDELRKATGGDLRMSGVGSEPGAKVGARYDVLSGGKGTVVKATGPAHLLEHPVKPHMIIPKKTGRGAKGRGSRRENKQALYNALFGSQWAGVKPLKTPWGPRYRVEHPGVRNPRKPWERGFKRSVPVIKRTVEQKFGKAFGRSLKG